MVKNKIADVDECRVNGIWRPNYVDFLLLTSICEDCGKRASMKDVIHALDCSGGKLSPAVHELGRVLGAIEDYDDEPDDDGHSVFDPGVDFYLAMKLAQEIEVGVVSVIHDLHGYGAPLNSTLRDIARRYGIMDWYE